MEYNIFFMHLSSKLAKEYNRHHFFSIEQFNFYSIHSKDYLEGRDGDFSFNLKSFLEKHEINLEYDYFILQTSPRVLGFQFNPVSFWFLKSKDEITIGVLVEVNNTFGERHFYFLDAKDLANESTKIRKRFHVSPFFKVEGYYQFRFFQNLKWPNQTRVDINYFDEQDKLLIATHVSGAKIQSTPNIFLRLFFKYGLISIMVVLRIHFNALLLWIKGVKFYSKPPPLRPVLTKGESVE